MNAPALKGLPILAACAALLVGPIAANASPYVVTLLKTAQGVVATGVGAIDLAGLELNHHFAPVPGAAQLNPSAAAILTGPTLIPSVVQYVGLIGPTNFGSGLDRVADDGSGDLRGDLVGICGVCTSLFVPKLYVSETALSGTSTYANRTFKSLGVTPGTYKWTWGTGADQSFTLEVGEAAVIATPLPATLPLSATGLGALGLLGWRRKRKGVAVAG
jgi:hypothetical protein